MKGSQVRFRQGTCPGVVAQVPSRGHTRHIHTLMCLFLFLLLLSLHNYKNKTKLKASWQRSTRCGFQRRYRLLPLPGSGMWPWPVVQVVSYTRMPVKWVRVVPTQSNELVATPTFPCLKQVLESRAAEAPFVPRAWTRPSSWLLLRSGTQGKGCPALPWLSPVSAWRMGECWQLRHCHCSPWA